MRSLLGLMVADGHAIATVSTDDQSLQQGGPFSRGAMTAIPSERLTVLTQLLAIGFIVVPGDVANMGVLEEKWPCLPLGRSRLGACHPTVYCCGSVRSRTPQHSADCARRFRTVLWMSGAQCMVPAWGPVRTRRGKSSPCSRKYLTAAQADPVRVIGGKQGAQGLLDLGIGIEPDGIDISHRPDQPAVGA